MKLDQIDRVRHHLIAVCALDFCPLKFDDKQNSIGEQQTIHTQAAAMEIELDEKGLPEGSASAPVSGYVYFPVVSRKKGTALQIEWVMNGNKVVLNLPQ